MTIGDIQVVFNDRGDGVKQYYEYYNDHQTIVTEDIKVFEENMTCEWYISIEDIARRPIEDATVRILQKTETEDDGFKLVQQRLTSSDGEVFFPMIPNTYFQIYVTHDDYTAVYTEMDTVEDCSVSETNPRRIILQDTNSYTLNGITYFIPIEFYNSTANIPIQLFTYQDDTNYYFDTEEYQAKTQITKTGDYTYLAILEAGTHFDSIDRDSRINLTIYSGSTLLTSTETKSFIIYYKPHANKTRLFENISTLSQTDNKYLPAILLLILVLASSMIGYAFKNKEQEHSGKTTFFIGTILISFIYPTFIIAGISVFIHMLYKMLNKGIAE